MGSKHDIVPITSLNHCLIDLARDFVHSIGELILGFKLVCGFKHSVDPGPVLGQNQLELQKVSINSPTVALSNGSNNH